MLYVAICTDKPDSSSLRQACRERHLAFLDKHAASLKIAGPFLDETGTRMVGSLFIVEAASKEACEAILADDSFAQEGLFASVEIRPWRWFVGMPSNGA